MYKQKSDSYHFETGVFVCPIEIRTMLVQAHITLYSEGSTLILFGKYICLVLLETASINRSKLARYTTSILHVFRKILKIIVIKCKVAK